MTRLNTKIDPLPLRDAAGKPVRLPESKATVVVFLSFECPVSNSYTAIRWPTCQGLRPEGRDLRRPLPVRRRRRAEVAKQAKEFKLAFPVFKDEGSPPPTPSRPRRRRRCSSSIATSCCATAAGSTTATTARLKKNRRSRSTTCSNALDELLAGRPVSDAGHAGGRLPDRCEQAASQQGRQGHLLPRRAADPAEPLPECHRPGEVGPFSLMTYKQAVNWADDIKEYTQDRKMPPWKPSTASAFHNDRRLSRQGDRHAGRLGRRRHARRATRRTRRRRESSPSGWQLGKPDLVLNVPDDDLPSARAAAICSAASCCRRT